MKRPEQALQKSICDLLNAWENQGQLRYFHVPNGGKRNKIEAAIMKGLGVRAGVPDLVVLISNGPTIFLELKAGDNKPTRYQQTWLEWLNNNGRPSYVVNDADQVYGIIKAAMVGRAA